MKPIWPGKKQKTSQVAKVTNETGRQGKCELRGGGGRGRSGRRRPDGLEQAGGDGRAGDRTIYPGWVGRAGRMLRGARHSPPFVPVFI